MREKSLPIFYQRVRSKFPIIPDEYWFSKKLSKTNRLRPEEAEVQSDYTLWFWGPLPKCCSHVKHLSIHFRRGVKILVDLRSPRSLTFFYYIHKVRLDEDGEQRMLRTVHAISQRGFMYDDIDLLRLAALACFHYFESTLRKKGLAAFKALVVIKEDEEGGGMEAEATTGEHITIN